MSIRISITARVLPHVSTIIASSNIFREALLESCQSEFPIHSEDPGESLKDSCSVFSRLINEAAYAPAEGGVGRTKAQAYNRLQSDRYDYPTGVGPQSGQFCTDAAKGIDNGNDT